MVVKFHMDGCHITHRYKLLCYLQCIGPYIHFITKSYGAALLSELCLLYLISLPICGVTFFKFIFQSILQWLSANVVTSQYSVFNMSACLQIYTRL